MEMKWHPIVNGDLSGIQQQETLLFTILEQKWKDLTENSRRSTDLSSEYRMTLFENHGRE